MNRLSTRVGPRHRMLDHARRRGSRGVALIEAAIVLPVLALLALGVIEGGFAYRDSNTLSRATQQAARVDSRLATNSLADYEALRSLRSGLSSLGASSITRVIVYRATTSGTTPPTACLAMARPDDTRRVGNANCNVYSRAQVLSDEPSSFGCGRGWDANFCPTARTRTGNNPTKLGIWVELRYDKVTKVLPGNLMITHGAVFQLEPCIAGDPSC